MDKHERKLYGYLYNFLLNPIVCAVILTTISFVFCVIMILGIVGANILVTESDITTQLPWIEGLLLFIFNWAPRIWIGIVIGILILMLIRWYKIMCMRKIMDDL